MEQEYQVGVWYKSGALLYTVEPTGRYRRNHKGEMVPEFRNLHTIQCSTPELAAAVLERLQPLTLPG